MEPRFEFHYALQKKDCYDFARVQSQRTTRWAWIVMRISVPLLIVLYAVLLLLDDSMPYLLICAMVVLFLQVFFPEINGNGTYAAARSGSLPDTFVFTDEQIQTSSPITSSNVAYAAIVDAAETDRIFALYVNRQSALVLPKNSIAPDEADQFRTFLEEKLGKPVRRFPANNKKRFFYLGAMLALAVALIAGAIFLRNWRNNRPQTFTTGAYSISLPQYFTEETPDTENGWLLEVSSHFVYVSVFNETDGELLDAGYSPAMSTSAYLEGILEFYDVTPETIVTTDSGIAYCFATGEFDGTTYCYCYAVQHGADAFWCTELFTTAALRSEYESLFLDWIQTIRIAD